MRTYSTKSKIVVAAVTAGTLAVSGVAYAYYASTASGSVDGSAATATSTVANVTPTAATTITGLVPGGSAQNATITLTNSNSYAVRIPVGKSISVASVTGPAGCADNTVALLSGTVGIPATTLSKSGAAGSTMTVVVPVSMADSTTVDQTSCNGPASFTVTYTVS